MSIISANYGGVQVNWTKYSKCDIDDSKWNPNGQYKDTRIQAEKDCLKWCYD